MKNILELLGLKKSSTEKLIEKLEEENYYKQSILLVNRLNKIRNQNNNSYTIPEICNTILDLIEQKESSKAEIEHENNGGC